MLYKTDKHLFQKMGPDTNSLRVKVVGTVVVAIAEQLDPCALPEELVFCTATPSCLPSAMSESQIRVLSLNCWSAVYLV